jgi:hypothetical protein
MGREGALVGVGPGEAWSRPQDALLGPLSSLFSGADGGLYDIPVPSSRPCLPSSYG